VHVSTVKLGARARIATSALDFFGPLERAVADSAQHFQGEL